MDFSELKERFLAFTVDQKRALISLSIIAIGIAIFFSLSSKSQAVYSAEPIRVEANSSSESSTAIIFIHVAGKVSKPGVYPVLRGTRVVDVIAHAGGALKGVDLSDINLARQVVDGEQIYVANAEINGPRGTSSKYSGKVNINRGTVMSFDSLPGIGPVIARRIVEYRKVNGPFLSLEDLKKVQGVGAKIFERIKGRLTL